MRKLILLAFIFLTFAFFLPAQAGSFPIHAYVPNSIPNNIYGIGIINHSDLEDASNLVNVNGGDWGYVTIVITEDQRDKQTWQNFFDDCRKLHLIPIVRVASKYEDLSWKIPQIENIDSWVNFFNSLNWVIENRYIVIGNEPNHAKEWGGKIEPEGYALYLKTFSERLKNANKDYFVLNAGFDQAAGNTKTTMDQKLFMQRMEKAIPDVFNFIDGWASHSYPNPGFSGPKTGTGRRSIRGYEWELELIKKDLPVFITETGWSRLNTKDELLTAANLKYAFEEVWSKDKRIITVTPFILNYQDKPFYEFSWKNKDGSFFKIYEEIQSINKVKGEPVQRISGEILFRFLNPIGTVNSNKKGYAFVKNTGQTIWEKQNVEVKIIDNQAKILDFEINSVEPFATGLLVYSLRFPEISDVYNINIGFFVNNNKIGDIYSGKIIILP